MWGPRPELGNCYKHSHMRSCFHLRERFLSHLGPQDLLKDGQWTIPRTLHTMEQLLTPSGVGQSQMKIESVT